MAPGTEIGLRFEYIDQTELRSGTGHVDRATIAFPAEAEIQQRTLSRSTWLEINQVFSPTWAVSLSLPYYDRYHTTVAEGDTAESASLARGIGDLRLLARFQQKRPGQSFGLQFGLKLPTGRFDQDFVTGPQAGELLDRGLQLGTGTTDFIGGLSWFARPAAALGCFAQVTVDLPLAAHQDFRPSDTLNFSGGVRWLNSSRFTPQVQLNVKAEDREHGALGDTANSGSTLAYFSPGITAELGTRARLFAFVQLPFYQRVNGLQLEPRWTFSTGWRLQW